MTDGLKSKEMLWKRRRHGSREARELVPESLEMSHFMLDTPRPSAANSPRENGRTSPSAESLEQEASINYEWQFEILPGGMGRFRSRSQEQPAERHGAGAHGAPEVPEPGARQGGSLCQGAATRLGEVACSRPAWSSCVAMGCGASAGVECPQSIKVVPLPEVLASDTLRLDTGGPARPFQVDQEDENMVSFKSYDWPDLAPRGPWPARPEHELHLRRLQRFMRRVQRDKGRFRALIGREAREIA